MRFFALLLLVTLGMMNGARAQSAATDVATPAFEVATVRQSSSDQSGGIALNPSRFRARHLTLRAMIMFAYQINTDSQLSGGPPWMTTAFYDVTAKAEPTKVEEIAKLPMDQQVVQLRVMLQSLLADRFALKLSTHTEELPAYALVITKGGSKLKESEPAPADPANPPLAGSNGAPPAPTTPGPKPLLGYTGQNTVTATNASMDLLIGWLARQPEVAGRIVVDKTGLHGKYDFVLDGVPPIKSTEEWTGASVFTLIQEQLGLKLLAEKASAKVLVIEHAEPATVN